jgi:hypothetical protein
MGLREHVRRMRGSRSSPGLTETPAFRMNNLMEPNRRARFDFLYPKRCNAYATGKNGEIVGRIGGVLRESR